MLRNQFQHPGNNRLQVNGWRVELIYLALPNVEMSRLRVAERVAHGGHNIPETDIARRFPRSLYNVLNIFASKANQTRCFMNNGGIPELVFQQTGAVREVLHPDFFELLQMQAQP